MTTKQFAGKTVWVTGASSGIGLAMARQLLTEGARVIVSARRVELLETHFGGDAHARIMPFDLAKADDITAAANAVNASEKVDVLILNAGLSQKSLALETTADVEQQLMAVNYGGAVHLAKAVVPQMIANGGGQIGVTGSIIGKIGGPYLTAYSAAKHALDGYFESWRYELQQHNVGVTIATLGFIQTDITKKSITGDGSTFGQDSKAQSSGMPAETCAKKILRAVRKRRKHRYIGRIEILFPFVRFICPPFFYWFFRKIHGL